jgi:hypothetical protein
VCACGVGERRRKKMTSFFKLSKRIRDTSDSQIPQISKTIQHVTSMGIREYCEMSRQ